MNWNKAYLLGAYLGDGCITTSLKKKPDYLVFKILTIDEDVICEVQTILAGEFDANVSIQIVKGKYFAVQTCRKNVIEFLTNQCGREKFWPSDCMSWPDYLKMAVLAGLLDTDGYTQYQENKMVAGKPYDQCHVGFVTTSDWIWDIADLVRSLGIRVGKITVSHNGQKNGHLGKKTVHKITLNVGDFVSAGAYFICARKHQRVVRYADKYSLSYPHRPYAKYADISGVKRWSGLHGDMQRQAEQETTCPVA